MTSPLSTAWLTRPQDHQGDGWHLSIGPYSPPGHVGARRNGRGVVAEMVARLSVDAAPGRPAVSELFGAAWLAGQAQRLASDQPVKEGSAEYARWADEHPMRTWVGADAPGADPRDPELRRALRGQGSLYDQVLEDDPDAWTPQWEMSLSRRSWQAVAEMLAPVGPASAQVFAEQQWIRVVGSRLLEAALSGQAPDWSGPRGHGFEPLRGETLIELPGPVVLMLSPRALHSELPDAFIDPEEWRRDPDHSAAPQALGLILHHNAALPVAHLVFADFAPRPGEPPIPHGAPRRTWSTHPVPVGLFGDDPQPEGSLNALADQIWTQWRAGRDAAQDPALRAAGLRGLDEADPGVSACLYSALLSGPAQP